MQYNVGCHVSGWMISHQIIETTASVFAETVRFGDRSRKQIIAGTTFEKNLRGSRARFPIIFSRTIQIVLEVNALEFSNFGGGITFDSRTDDDILDKNARFKIKPFRLDTVDRTHEIASAHPVKSESKTRHDPSLKSQQSNIQNFDTWIYFLFRIDALPNFFFSPSSQAIHQCNWQGRVLCHRNISLHCLEHVIWYSAIEIWN